MSVGMAMAEAHLAARFNRPGHTVVDHHTYVLVGDGDLMEGVALEADLAGRPSAPRKARGPLRFQPHLPRGCHRPLLHARHGDGRSSRRAGTSCAWLTATTSRRWRRRWPRPRPPATVPPSSWFPDADRVRQSQAGLVRVSTARPSTPSRSSPPSASSGYPSEEPFFVPAEVSAQRAKIVEKGKALEAEWKTRFDAYRKAHPRARGRVRARHGWPAPRGLGPGHPQVHCG